MCNKLVHGAESHKQVSSQAAGVLCGQNERNARCLVPVQHATEEDSAARLSTG